MNTRRTAIHISMRVEQETGASISVIYRQLQQFSGQHLNSRITVFFRTVELKIDKNPFEIQYMYIHMKFERQ